MKRPVSKADIRIDINKQIAEYLNRGGEVVEVERGVSGRENADAPLKPGNTAFQQPKMGRTYVPEVIAAIDARRNPKPVKTRAGKPKPRKKIIYDDFGEPLRWQWVEE